MDAVHSEGFHNRTAYWQIRDQIKALDANKSLRPERKMLLQCQLYANHPYLLGLQVKQLIGGKIVDFSKTDNIPKLDALVDKAIARLGQFFFVGVFDEYVRSMKLFHHLAKVGKYCFNFVIFFC